LEVICDDLKKTKEKGNLAGETDAVAKKRRRRKKSVLYSKSLSDTKRNNARNNKRNNANRSNVRAAATKIKKNSDGLTLSEDDLRAALEKEGVHGDAAINAYLSQVKNRIASRLLTREFLSNSTDKKYVENRSSEDCKKIEESNLAILKGAVHSIKKVSGTEEFVAVYIGNCKSTRIVLEGFEVRLTNASANNEPTNTRPCLAAAALLRQERAESRAGAGASEASEKTTWCRSNGCRCCGLLLPLLLLPLLLLPLPSKR